MSRIEAVFPTEDDALSVSTHLLTMNGIQNIQTERRTNDSTGNGIYWMGLLGMNTSGNMTDNSISSSGNFAGQSGAFAFAGDSFDGEEGTRYGYDVLLSCSVEEGQRETVIAAIKEAGGRVIQ